jgi:hypothetical protein
MDARLPPPSLCRGVSSPKSITATKQASRYLQKLTESIIVAKSVWSVKEFDQQAPIENQH